MDTGALKVLCDDFRSQLARSRDTRTRLRLLEAVLAALAQLDAGMFQGAIISPSAAKNAGGALAQVAGEIFGTLRDADPGKTGDWLGQLPRFLQPRAIDLASWRSQLNAPADRTEWFRRRREQRAQALEALLEQSGNRDGPLELRALERVFRLELPARLRRAWQAALEGGSNDRRFIRGTLPSLLKVAWFVTDEQAALELIPESVEGRPFPILPFAEGENPSDYWVLELSAPTGAGDFRVLHALHDVGGSGGQLASSDEWLRTPPPED
jgi:hypothetical protein